MPLPAQTSLFPFIVTGRVVVRRTPARKPLPKGRTTIAVKLEGLEPRRLYFHRTTSVTPSLGRAPPAPPKSCGGVTAGRSAKDAFLRFASEREGGADTVAREALCEPTRRSIGCLTAAAPWTTRVEAAPLSQPKLVRTAARGGTRTRLPRETGRPAPSWPTWTEGTDVGGRCIRSWWSGGGERLCLRVPPRLRVAGRCAADLSRTCSVPSRGPSGAHAPPRRPIKCPTYGTVRPMALAQAVCGRR